MGFIERKNKNVSILCRRAAAQGAVLLQNRDQVLPLTPKDHVAVFGRCQTEYYRSGTGSGGAVNAPYTVSLLEGLREDGVRVNEDVAACYDKWLAVHPFDDGGGGWACEPWCQQEMPLSDALVRRAAEVSNKALVVIGRTAGEDKDNTVQEGSYLLTAAEKDMLAQVCKYFHNVVVILNVSNMIDLSLIQEQSCVKVIVYAWQGGMEGGSGIADVLTGRETFQGKLTDTIARQITDYPSHCNHGGRIRNVYQEDIYVGYRYFETFAKENVLYPFGFGLTYTEFALFDGAVRVEGSGADTEFLFTCRVKNMGTVYSGRETVQLYVQKPETGLGNPCRELAGFAKTGELKCGAEEEVEIRVPVSALVSYDDSGVSSYRDSYVLEAGSYIFCAGTNVRDAQTVPVDGAWSWEVPETLLIRKCVEAAAPVEGFERMRAAAGENGSIVLEYEPVPVKTIDLRKRIAEELPQTIAGTGDQGLLLQDVADGRCSMETFIAQLSVEDLAAIARGEGMCSIKVTAGTAAAFGGVSDRLSGFGVPVGCCADGPSGIRMDNGAHASQVPIGTLLACTWDEKLVEELYSCVGREMLDNQIDALLGPGINIHRHPLNGRNFEYYSEDPFLSGKMAAAVVRGIGRNGVHAVIKHFACNSQEAGRHIVNAVVSQRALRQIYLRAFEIAVKEGGAQAVMTAYNPINGYWTASNYDLTTTILRKEWGFTGMVMTDWWAAMNDVTEGGKESKTRTADMIRAQNDVYMVVNNNGAEINAMGDDTIEAVERGRLTMGELQRGAMNICRFLMCTPALGRQDSRAAKIPFIRAMKLRGAVRQEAGEDQRISLQISAPAEKDFYIGERGYYDVIVRLMSPQTDRAQTVCKAVLNGEDLVTFQTNGTEGKWILQKLLRVELEKGSYQITFEFPKPGMVIDYMEWRKVSD